MIKDVALIFMAGVSLLWFFFKAKRRWRWVLFGVVMICGVAYQSRFVKGVSPWEAQFWHNLRPPLYSLISKWQWGWDWPFLAILILIIYWSIAGLLKRTVRQQKPRLGESAFTGSCPEDTK